MKKELELTGRWLVAAKKKGKRTRKNTRHEANWQSELEILVKVTLCVTNGRQSRVLPTDKATNWMDSTRFHLEQSKPSYYLFVIHSFAFSMPGFINHILMSHHTASSLATSDLIRLSSSRIFSRMGMSMIVLSKTGIPAQSPTSWGRFTRRIAPLPWQQKKPSPSTWA